MEIVAPTPQKPAKVELPPAFQNSFNVSLTHNKAMTVVNETIEKFVQTRKVHALGFGIFQANDRELAELNEALKLAFQKFTL